MKTYCYFFKIILDNGLSFFKFYVTILLANEAKFKRKDYEESVLKSECICVRISSFNFKIHVSHFCSSIA